MNLIVFTFLSFFSFLQQYLFISEPNNLTKMLLSIIALLLLEVKHILNQGSTFWGSED